MGQLFLSCAMLSYAIWRELSYAIWREINHTVLSQIHEPANHLQYLPITLHADRPYIVICKNIMIASYLKFIN